MGSPLALSDPFSGRIRTPTLTFSAVFVMALALFELWGEGGGRGGWGVVGRCVGGKGDARKAEGTT